MGHVLEFPSPLVKSMYVGLAGSSNFVSFAAPLRTDITFRERNVGQQQKKARPSRKMIQSTVTEHNGT